MFFNEITNDFKVKIVSNKFNDNLLDSLNPTNKNKLMNFLQIHAISAKINFSAHKIKQVENSIYLKHKIYEYKIQLDKNLDIRLAFSIDYDNKIIYIVAMMVINEKIRKFKFDELVAKQYHK